MHGKVCLVTGATRGLGQAAALGLARAGATVVIVARDRARIENTLALLRAETGNQQVEGLQADLSRLADVRLLAERFRVRYPSLDVLVNNVGATLLKYQATYEGYEMTWSLNYLGHFLLTHLLKDPLDCAAETHGEARVVEVTSSVYRYSRPDFRKLQRKERYNGALAYAQSKRAMLVYVMEMARRMNGCGVTINAVTPGAVKTHIASDVRGLNWVAMQVINAVALPPDAGVRPILRLAAAPELRGVTGQYFRKTQKMPPDPSLTKPEIVRQLWEISEVMTGLC